MTSKTEKAKARLDSSPKSLLPSPPAMLFIATGIKVIPITVTTDPVTTGGKNLTSFPKKKKR